MAEQRLVVRQLRLEKAISVDRGKAFQCRACRFEVTPIDCESRREPLQREVVWKKCHRLRHQIVHGFTANAPKLEQRKVKDAVEQTPKLRFKCADSCDSH